MAGRVFVLPDLGEGLDEAVVTAWLVAEGDTVALNQPFVEIETAKATVEVPAPFAGVVTTLHVSAGETLAVGAPLATFEVAGVGVPSPAAEAPSTGIASETTRSSGTTPRSGGPSAATPAVRRLAKDRGVDLGSVNGTGSGGRITREDVERVAGGEGASEGVVGGEGGGPTPTTAAEGGGFELVPLTPARRAIAGNLEEVARIPQVTTFRTVDCTDLEAIRAELGVSPLPLFVRALAEITAEHPAVNASWSQEGIRLHRSVDVGIATDTERGLVVPVLRDVRSLGVGAIADAISRLADRARDGTLTPGDLAGATIAVTNTGSYGSEYGTPLLDPGHAVTIALGVIAPRALVVDGAVEARPACTLSLTFDHRVLDGATVGRAFGALVRLLESREDLERLTH